MGRVHHPRAVPLAALRLCRVRGRSLLEDPGGKSYVFRLRDHMERLHRSCKIAMIDLPYSVDELCQATVDVIRANKLKKCYIRPLVYRGCSQMGVDPPARRLM